LGSGLALPSGKEGGLVSQGAGEGRGGAKP